MSQIFIFWFAPLCSTLLVKPNNCISNPFGLRCIISALNEWRGHDDSRVRDGEIMCLEATHFSCARNLQFTEHAFVFRRLFGARVVLHHIPEAHHPVQLEVAHRLNLGMHVISNRDWLVRCLISVTSGHSSIRS